LSNLRERGEIATEAAHRTLQVLHENVEKKAQRLVKKAQRPVYVQRKLDAIAAERQ